MGKFTINYNTKTRGLPTLFKHQYFTIDKNERNNWDYNKLDQYLGEYRLVISDTVKKI